MNAQLKARLDWFCACKTVNWHEHVWFDASGNLHREELARLLALSDRFGIEKSAVSLPVLSGSARPELVRRANDTVMEAVQLHPGRLYGMCFVDPGFHDFALQEIRRCVCGLGFIGIKLYNQYTVDDPVVMDILELAAELDVPVLEHAGKLNAYQETQPLISNGEHFARAAQRHPNTNFILAHIGGGGDWEYQVKAIAPYANVSVDMSGSVFDAGMLEFAVEHLGAQRILFGSDGSMMACVGKILGCTLDTPQLETILRGDAFARYWSKQPLKGAL
mgnify:CR=1 FL=1